MNFSRRCPKKNVNMPTNLWNIKTNVVVQLYFWISRSIDVFSCLSCFYESFCLPTCRNQLNKVGLQLLKLMKLHYNWKRMFTKHCSNCTHMLADTSKIITEIILCLYRFLSVAIHTFPIILKKNFSMNRLNRLKNIRITLPTYVVLVLVLANISLIVKNFKIKFFQAYSEKTFFPAQPFNSEKRKKTNNTSTYHNNKQFQ